MKLVIIRQMVKTPANPGLNKPAEFLHHPVLHAILELDQNHHVANEERERLLRIRGQEVI